MSNTDYDDQQEIRREPPRAKQKAKKKKPARRVVAKSDPEVVHADAAVTRTSPRPSPRYESTRDTNREPSRRNAVIAVGHNGEQLARRRTSVGDKFDIPKSEWPAGWEYQWNAVTVLNQGMQEIIRGDLQMYENGWRAVPSSRYPGRWTPHDHEGAIVVEGSRLEERPLSLGDEARSEDQLRAKALIRDRTDALRMTQKQLPGASVASKRNNAGGMRMTIDPGLDIPHPEHEIDIEE